MHLGLLGPTEGLGPRESCLHCLVNNPVFNFSVHADMSMSCYCCLSVTTVNACLELCQNHVRVEHLGFHRLIKCALCGTVLLWPSLGCTDRRARANCLWLSFKVSKFPNWNQTKAQTEAELFMVHKISLLLSRGSPQLTCSLEPPPR